MKKTLTLIAIATMFAFVACGPNKEEAEKKAQATKDSLMKDSTDKANAAADKAKAMQDSIDNANAMKAKAMADSLHQDSITKKLIKVKK